MIPPSAPRPEIRLAAPADPGANLYNGYHYLVLLAGLYDGAGRFDHRPVGRKLWGELADHALGDVGEVFAAWETIVHRPPAPRAPGSPAPAFDAVGRSVVQACNRAVRLGLLLGEWTPMLRWAQILRLAERRWQIVCEHLAEAEPSVGARLLLLRKTSLDRQSRLHGATEALEQERRRMRAGIELTAATAPAGALVIE